MSAVNVAITTTPKADALIRRFGASGELGTVMARVMDRENQLAVGDIKAKLSGPVLNRVTGRLRDSIGRTQALITGDTLRIDVRSSIGSGTGQGAEAVRYAAIHEFGGRIQIQPRSQRIHVVEGKFASKKQFKRHIKKFDGDNTYRRDTYHRAYTIKMPERSYLRSTIREHASRYSTKMSNAIVAFYEGKN